MTPEPALYGRLAAIGLIGVVLQVAALSQIGVFGVPPDKLPAFRAAFGVPEGFRPVGCVSFGYPGDDDRRSPSLRRGRRPVEEVVHRGRW